MRPPDGPPGPNESDWAHVIQIELNSWDPRLLSPRFQPRRRQRAVPVLRPLPLALVTLLVVALAAAVLAGGPRALTLAIVNLASGRPQPTATPAPPAPHRGGAGLTPSVFGPGSGSASGGPLGTPTPSQGNPSAQPANSPAAAAGGGAPNQGRNPGSAGMGQAPSSVGQEQAPPSQHQGTPIPQLPPDSPTLPTLPTLPPIVHVMPPAHPTMAPTPSPPAAVPGAGVGSPLPQPTTS
jgi:hypothetical protein